ncbi:MAG: hypothetical protein H7A35_16040 [Planctomycetales bacterium]|nr:hypothetical protein [bacterium]UNM08339.1 MAG: hypothetical protein H7A35_16040 [Planctomycetales bacterium]
MTNKGSNTGRWLMGVISVAVVAGIILIAVPMVFGNHRHPQYQETEVKQNLHSIQLAIERYAVDSEGRYPQWISGGSHAPGSLGGPDAAYTADVLIMESYMPSCPANPFARTGQARNETRRAVREMQELLNDPLQPVEGGDLSAPAYRFGKDYELMGNVLADPRFAEVIVGTDSDGNAIRKRTGTDVIYRCWDTEALDKPQYWLQGQFMYKSFGPLIAAGDAGAEPDFGKLHADMYMLAGYGSVRTKGQDVLGPEQQLRPESGAQSQLRLLNYTGLSIPGFSGRQASPFSFGGTDAEQPLVSFGNPNGITDGLIMVLTAGQQQSMALQEREADVLAVPDGDVLEEGAEAQGDNE